METASGIRSGIRSRKVLAMLARTALVGAVLTTGMLAGRAVAQPQTDIEPNAETARTDSTSPDMVTAPIITPSLFGAEAEAGAAATVQPDGTALDSQGSVIGEHRFPAAESGGIQAPKSGGTSEEPSGAEPASNADNPAEAVPASATDSSMVNPAELAGAFRAATNGLLGELPEDTSVLVPETDSASGSRSSGAGSEGETSAVADPCLAPGGSDSAGEAGGETTTTTPPPAGGCPAGIPMHLGGRVIVPEVRVKQALAREYVSPFKNCPTGDASAGEFGINLVANLPGRLSIRLTELDSSGRGVGRPSTPFAPQEQTLEMTEERRSVWETAIMGDLSSGEVSYADRWIHGCFTISGLREGQFYDLTASLVDDEGVITTDFMSLSADSLGVAATAERRSGLRQPAIEVVRVDDSHLLAVAPLRLGNAVVEVTAGIGTSRSCVDPDEAGALPVGEVERQVISTERLIAQGIRDDYRFYHSAMVALPEGVNGSVCITVYESRSDAERRANSAQRTRFEFSSADMVNPVATITGLHTTGLEPFAAVADVYRIGQGGTVACDYSRVYGPLVTPRPAWDAPVPCRFPEGTAGPASRFAISTEVTRFRKRFTNTVVLDAQPIRCQFSTCRQPPPQLYEVVLPRVPTEQRLCGDTAGSSGTCGTTEFPGIVKVLVTWNNGSTNGQTRTTVSGPTDVTSEAPLGAGESSLEE